MPKARDLSVEKFGRLQPIRRIPLGRSEWVCQCDCGKETTTRAYNLVKGITRSCGCLVVDTQRASHTKHGLCTSRQYACYKNMIQRCHNPHNSHYPNHGGRGISVCDHWRKGFVNFWEDMKEGYADNLTIERVDNDGNYEKSNCIWADMTTQQNNKRTNQLITAFGKSLTSYQWGREVGLHHETIRSRLRLGWTPEDALSLKPGKAKYYNRSSNRPSSTAD